MDYQSWWNKPLQTQTLGDIGNALGQGLARPFGGLEDYTAPMASRGPEDVGKTQARILAEQAFGAPLNMLAQGLNLPAEFLFGGGSQLLNYLGSTEGQQPNPVGVDGLTQAGVRTAFNPSAQDPNAPQVFNLGNVGQAPQYPQAQTAPGVDYAGYLGAMAQMGPTPPGAMPTMPQLQGPVAPNTSAQEDYIAALGAAAPEAPEQKTTGQKLLGVLGALSAGANRAGPNAGLREVLASTGPVLSQYVIETEERAKAEDKEFKAATLRHQAAMTQAQAQLEGIRREYENAVRETQNVNAERTYESQVRAQEQAERYQNAQRDFSLQLTETALRMEEASVNATQRALDRQFEAEVANFKIKLQRAPSLSIDNGNYSITRTDDAGNITVEVLPAGRGAQSIKRMLDLGGNDNLPPAFRSRVNSQAAFMSAVEMGDEALVLDVVADDILQNPAGLGDMESELVRVQKEAQNQGFFPGTGEYTDFVRQRMTASVAELLRDPKNLDAAATVYPLAKAYRDMTK